MDYGELSVRLSGGDDREGGGDGPLVILLHGYGAPGEDLVPFGRALDVPDGTRFAFPAAPISLATGFGARAWWHIDIEALERAMTAGQHRDQRHTVPEELAETRRLAGDTIRALVAGLGAKKVVLGGFSQGAMLALDLALCGDLGDTDLAGLVLMSGTLLAEDQWRPQLPSRRGLPVFQSHGQVDALLSFEAAEELRGMLDEAGLPVTFVPFRGGHEIPPPVLEGLEAFLKEALG